MARPETVMNAIYRGRIASDRLMELAPVVVRAAVSGDAAARRILDEQADEIALMATATIRRLRLTGTEVEVVLGGGMFRADDPEFVGRIEKEVGRVAPSAQVTVLRAPPIVGAALLGLDELGAPASASARVRATIDHATIDDAIGRTLSAHRPSRGT
jgi:N-acetylglucosamine kinase-like BadF-type ATPase